MKSFKLKIKALRDNGAGDAVGLRLFVIEVNADYMGSSHVHISCGWVFIEFSL